MSQPKHDSYHHGDARNALLAAAAALIESAGAQGLSLRAVAARAGLSRQAPYNHFADKEALLAELAADGFRRLGARIRATPGYPASAASLERAADAYIGFAQRAPALFRLMFSCELVDLSHFPDAARVADDAYQSLVGIVTTLAIPARVADLSLAAWCIVHGYATLCIETGMESPGQRASRARLFAHIIRNAARGDGEGGLARGDKSNVRSR